VSVPKKCSSEFENEFSVLGTKHCSFHFAEDRLVIAPDDKDLECEACSLSYT
jgi:hypothetical protein